MASVPDSKKPAVGSDKDVVFGYFTLDSVEGTGHICVALRRPPKGSRSRKYQAAVAFGSPLDTLNKKIGRVISFGRLMTKRPGRSFALRAAEGDSLQALLLAAATKAMSKRTKMKSGPSQNLRSYAPRWALGAIEAKYELEPLFTKTAKPKRRTAKKGVVKASSTRTAA